MQQTETGFPDLSCVVSGGCNNRKAAGSLRRLFQGSA
jgi:hypothetical protein